MHPVVKERIRIPYQKINFAAASEQELRQEERQTRWLVWVQGIMGALLLLLTLLGIGVPFSEELARSWENAGLVGLFVLVYSMQFPNMVIRRLLVKHVLRLYDQQPKAVAEAESARQLNEVLPSLLRLKLAFIIPLTLPLGLLAMVKVFWEDVAFWQYLGPVYALGVILLLSAQYRRYQQVRRNIEQFNELLPQGGLRA